MRFIRPPEPDTTELLLSSSCTPRLPSLCVPPLLPHNWHLSSISQVPPSRCAPNRTAEDLQIYQHSRPTSQARTASKSPPLHVPFLMSHTAPRKLGLGLDHVVIRRKYKIIHNSFRMFQLLSPLHSTPSYFTLAFLPPSVAPFTMVQ